MEASLIMYGGMYRASIHSKHLPRPRPHLPHALCRGL